MGTRKAEYSVHYHLFIYNFIYEFTHIYRLFIHLLSNNICTPLITNPHFMNPPLLHINSRTHAIGHFSRILLSRIGDGQFPSGNQMGGQGVVGMGRVVGVSGNEACEM